MKIVLILLALLVFYFVLERLVNIRTLDKLAEFKKVSYEDMTELRELIINECGAKRADLLYKVSFAIVSLVVLALFGFCFYGIYSLPI